MNFENSAGYDQRLKKLCEELTDRLAPEALRGIVDYADFGELALAMEMLCEQLTERKTPLSFSEFHAIRDLAEEAELDDEQFQQLKQFIE